MQASFAQKENPLNPRNYPVPDFGLSHEILYTQNNIKNSEKKFGRKLKVSWDQKDNGENPRGYSVANFGLDNDIKASLNSLDLEEGIHGYWNIDGSTDVSDSQDTVATVEKEQIKKEKEAIDGTSES